MAKSAHLRLCIKIYNRRVYTYEEADTFFSSLSVALIPGQSSDLDCT